MIEYSVKRYPEIEPYNTFMLNVSDGHELYVEECGNPKGKPVVFLHGGPGAGITPKHRQNFHPEKYRVILFDQRGCGKSKPFASIENNTTDHLIEDIEVLRKHLNIDKWQVFGGSWGCFLGVAYAGAYPERVTELIVRGVFLGTQRETDWLYKFGASEVFYDEWVKFKEWIPVKEQGDLLAAYTKRLNDKDMKVCIEAAGKWNAWEMGILSLYKDVQNLTNLGENALPIARLECHYAMNDYFENGRIMKGIPKIQNIPGVIIHGQYDMVCAARSAFELKKLWPKADLKIVPDAGHAASDPGNVHELISATNRFAI